MSTWPVNASAARARSFRSGRSLTLALGLMIVLGLLLVPSSVGAGRELHATGAPARSLDVQSPSARGATVLAITSFAASVPKVDQGQATYLNVTAVGGTPPYSYQYTGLPHGCRSVNAPSDPCFPNETEQFTITVIVNDSVGASANASLALSVVSGFGGPPVINSFYASPGTSPTESVVHILVNATSSSSTPTLLLKVFFAHLPPGCASFNQTDLECIPTAPGTFHLYVQVTDGFGAVAIAWTWLNVTGGAPSSTTPTVTGPVGLWIGIGVVAFVLVVAGIMVLPRIRRPRNPSAAQPWKP